MQYNDRISYLHVNKWFFFTFGFTFILSRCWSCLTKRKLKKKKRMSQQNLWPTISKIKHTANFIVIDKKLYFKYISNTKLRNIHVLFNSRSYRLGFLKLENVEVYEFSHKPVYFAVKCFGSCLIIKVVFGRPLVGYNRNHCNRTVYERSRTILIEVGSNTFFRK